MQNFGRKNFDNSDSTCSHQIRQTFPPSKFYTIRYNNKVKLVNTPYDMHSQDYTIPGNFRQQSFTLIVAICMTIGAELDADQTPVFVTSAYIQYTVPVSNLQ